MEFTAKKSVEPSISLIKLSGMMDHDQYQAFYKEACELIDEDHSLVVDFSDVTLINEQGIQAIIALSQRSKRFNNVMIVFGLNDEVAQTFHKNKALEELTITNNNYEAMSIAQHLQGQKDELRQIPFGRKIETPPQTQSTANEATDIESSPLYKMVESKAREAASWNSILEQRLGNEPIEPSTADEGLETVDEAPVKKDKTQRERSSELTSSDETDTKKRSNHIPATHATPALVIDEGLNSNEKDALFGEPQAKPTRRQEGVRHRHNRARPNSKLTPILLFMVFTVGILHFFKDPIYALMFPEKYQLALQMINEPHLHTPMPGEQTNNQSNSIPQETPALTTIEKSLPLTGTTQTDNKVSDEIKTLSDPDPMDLTSDLPPIMLETLSPAKPNMPITELIESHVNQLASPTTTNPFNDDGLFDQPATVTWKEQAPQEFDIDPGAQDIAPAQNADNASKKDDDKKSTNFQPNELDGEDEDPHLDFDPELKE